MRRYAASLDHLARARKVIHGGASTLSKMASRFPEGVYPTALTHGRGSHVWDLDGNEYVDWICGLACSTLGHAHPALVAAQRAQLERGVHFSLPSVLEAEVAERLVALIPCAQHDGMVRFVSTGSEASEAAIRVARRATDRDVVIGIGYHSWHSAFMAQKPEHPGVPDAYALMMRDVPFNDLSALAQALAEGNIAAVFLEPVIVDPPTHGYLQAVQRMTHDAGALLIFDEVVCGLRWALAGAQEYFGITPDLATYGKALANGLPIGALVGPRALMELADVVSGTFNGCALTMATILAVLDVYHDEPILARIWSAGQRVIEAGNQAARYLGVPARIVGYPPHPKIVFDHPEATTLMSLFLQETAARGVLLHYGGINASGVHTDADVVVTNRAIFEALEVVRSALEWGELDRTLKGQRIQESFVRRTA